MGPNVGLLSNYDTILASLLPFEVEQGKLLALSLCGLTAKYFSVNIDMQNVQFLN